MTAEYLLVVDDDAALGRLVVRALSVLGLQVHLAIGAPDAWRFVHQEGRAPAALITDVHLGSGDGRLLAGHLRDVYPGMPVLLMSGGFAAGSIPFVQGEGRQQYLPKPFGTRDLLTKVKYVLSSTARPWATW